MSLRVLVIPEDPTHNGHILRPLVQAIVVDCGRVAPNVKILENPRVRGYQDAVRAIRDSLVDRYGWYDLWLFFPDADLGKTETMERLESDLEAHNIQLICSPAVPEVEIYACAGFRGDMSDAWNEARKNPRFKEEVFEPLLAVHGDATRPGGGRDLMVKKSLRNLPTLYQLCPELVCLRDRIVECLSDQ